MRTLLAVALGSALGGAGRYLVQGAVQRWTGDAFPWGTLAVNVTGSFLLGLLLRYALDSAAISAGLRTFLAIGLCGGYTTFSAFGWETVALLEAGDWRRAGAYVTLSLALTIGATLLGVMAARELLNLRRG